MNWCRQKALALPPSWSAALSFEESCWEVVYAPLRQGGVLTALGAGEWLVSAFPQGQSVDALFAVVVAAREDLGLCVMLVTDGTRDLLL